MVDSDVVFAAFDAGQQIAAVGDDKVGPDIEFTCQQLAQFDFESGELVAILEVEWGSVGFNGYAQLAPVVDVINQFGMSQRAQKG
ncbi:hypothetical protein D3C73_1147030 [compost metagenome]